MSIPVVTVADLSRLADLLPDLDFGDAERRNVLLESGTRDVQAAPGSGKTSLLAAKLLLLAARWPHRNRGICVLSHTNVARDEITRRLGQTGAGARLLSYPHFVGTIHAFVNEFLALPMLRSRGVAVELVDDDVFKARAIAELTRKRTLQMWAKNRPNGLAVVGTLRYEGDQLLLAAAEGNLPARDTPSYTEAKQLKDNLSNRGIFRHDDMFAFAVNLLSRFPNLPQRISMRFPLLLIDEMQDTNWAQEELLGKVFDDTVIVQRYGDGNQRILVSAHGADNLSFPRGNHLNIVTTKRFPDHIAAAVRAVQEHGEAVTAASAVQKFAPVLILYDTEATTRVIARFGELVLSTLPDEVLSTGPVKAVCARKQSEADQTPGRHLGDYWPGYGQATATSAGQETICHLLADRPGWRNSTLGFANRVRDVRRAVLLCLRAVGCAAVKDLRDGAGLMRRLDGAGLDTAPIRRLCHKLSLSRELAVDATAWSATVDLLFAALTWLLPEGYTRQVFGDLPALAFAAEKHNAAPASAECLVKAGDRTLTVQIGTVASVKGETHVATLVLESLGHPSRKFDLQAALSNISSGERIAPKAPESIRGQYRNLYVAMSRPRHLLCLAMNAARADQEAVEVLKTKGWQVIALTATEKSATPATEEPAT